MKREEIFEKVVELCKDAFDNDEIEILEETSQEDIDEWDSLTNIQLISDIEKEFGLKFTMEEIKGFATVGELVDLIEKKRK